jgi:hypothetical protein
VHAYLHVFFLCKEKQKFQKALITLIICDTVVFSNIF